MNKKTLVIITTALFVSVLYVLTGCTTKNGAVANTAETVENTTEAVEEVTTEEEKAITVENVPRTLGNGESFTLKPTYDGASEFTFRSLKPDVLTVDKDGKVTAVGYGKGTISISVPGVTVKYVNIEISNSTKNGRIVDENETENDSEVATSTTTSTNTTAVTTAQPTETPVAEQPAETPVAEQPAETQTTEQPTEGRVIEYTFKELDNIVVYRDDFRSTETTELDNVATRITE